MTKKPVNRRDFLKIAGLGMGGALLGDFRDWNKIRGWAQAVPTVAD